MNVCIIKPVALYSTAGDPTTMNNTANNTGQEKAEILATRSRTATNTGEKSEVALATELPPTTITSSFLY